MPKTPNPLDAARNALAAQADPKKSQVHRSFFTNSVDDIFLGVPTPTLRRLAKDFAHLSLTDIRRLLRSKIHDERSLANEILRAQFLKAAEKDRHKIFDFYIRNLQLIREWDGVDGSAPYIVGPWLLDRDKTILYELARAPRIWDRRIAIVSTWWFIRNGRVDDTFAIAEILLDDPEDLIHKATGWMLREAGKKDLRALERFLRKHHASMPRTMLRYAIERFSPEERAFYVRLRPAK
jgi:3-methyladenine DNA glycosylase AlkD